MWKAFGRHVVLEDVSLSLAEGEVACIIGPSGGGKSTLLRSVNGLERIDSGRIYVDGQLMGYREAGSRLHELSTKALSRSRVEIGMVFQHFNLFPHLTALQNVALGPRHVRREQKRESEAAGMELLARVGLREKSDAYPRELSGGQQQRVAIARALAMRPRLMLFDEPTSALDPELVGEVLKVMEDLAAQNMTMLVVTHEMQFAWECASRVAFMAEGRIVELGPASRVLGDPAEQRTKEFLRRVRVFDPKASRAVGLLDSGSPDS